ncbi:MAG: methyltransferase [Clostridia bacterium]|nr:methyltransferase [Clostridia bacterium]
MEVVEDLLIDNLKIYQDDELYRFTSDAVILSKFASAKKGDVVADFCSGSGIVGIHYYALNKNAKSVDLVEIQPELANLSKKSIKVNNLENVFTVINQPIQSLSKEFNDKYSLILCNPPYKKAGSGEVNGDIKIAMCRHEVTVTQEEIVEVASKKLKHGGRLCMCQRTERFTDLVLKMASVGLEPTKIQFVVTELGKAPYLFLIESVKGVKPQLKILPEFVNKGV